MKFMHPFLKNRTTMFVPLVALLGLFGTSACTDENDNTTPTFVSVEDKGWAFSATPVWADEFDSPGKPDPSKWTYEIGNSGWGNNELQYYTKAENVNIAGGVLTIEARKEERNGAKYTSSRMVTRGLTDFLYGRFEAKIKVPPGKGTWPAFWMLPTDNVYGTWPKSGEIDVMEHVGKDPQNVHISAHMELYNGANGKTKTSTKNLPTATTDFHVYRVDWTPYALRGYVDNEKIFEYINSNTGYASWPFNKRFFLLLNVAVGGNWGGPTVDDAIFPAQMQVDYVRVYSLVN
jgi:beta-glucanase (GH16 family)